MLGQILAGQFPKEEHLCDEGFNIYNYINIVLSLGLEYMYV